MRRLEEEYDNTCPNCHKILDCASLTRKTVLRHADGECAVASQHTAHSTPTTEEPLCIYAESIAADVQLPSTEARRGDRETPSLESEDDGDTDEKGDTTDEDTENLFDALAEDLEWESGFLDNENTVQIGGSRMTAAQVRQNLSEKINNETTLAKLLLDLLKKDEPFKVLESHLHFARLANGPSSSIIPKSMHLVKRALELRSLHATNIHICAECCRFAWKPIPKKDWPQCPEECTCKHCTCPSCKEHNGKISKRFRKTVRGNLEPNQVG